MTDNPASLVERLKGHVAYDYMPRECRDAMDEAAAALTAKDEQIARLRHIAADLVQHIDWLTNGLPEMLDRAALVDGEGLIGAAVDAANSARTALEQPHD